jgi:RHS repeat-associated protein
MQGAGGVGGLLLTEEIGTSTTAYHFQYDGNGNVTEITDLSGNPAASYRYDAFGNTLVATGSYAAANNYRFSTKPLDAEVTNAPLYYYAYRFYDPVTGRWPSRDPIEERGGVNLYGFVGNSAVNKRDYLGLWGKQTGCNENQIATLKKAEANAREGFSNWYNFLDSTVDNDYLMDNFPWLGQKAANLRLVLTFNDLLKSKNNRLVQAIDSGSYDVECECSCKTIDFLFGPTIAYTWGGKTIHFCPQFFTDSEAEQAATLGHELSHAVLHTGDDVHWVNPSANLLDSLYLAPLYEDEARFKNNAKMRYPEMINATVAP